MQEWNTVDMERVERCITLLRELSVEVLPDDAASSEGLTDALHLTMSRSFLIAYAMHREAGLDHDAAIRRLHAPATAPPAARPGESASPTGA